MLPERHQYYLAALLHDIRQYPQTTLPDWAKNTGVSQEFIQYVLRLSSGAMAQTAPTTAPSKTVKPILTSVFQTLQANKAHLPQLPLALQHTVFPIQNTTPESDAAASALVKGFAEACKQLDTSTAVGGVLPLLHLYGTALPAKTSSLPDVSLYDHSKSAAAIALCLYDYVIAHKLPIAPIQASPETAPLLLIGGDISGIQSYIYDIVSKYAAKNLKGRSYYLQLLVDAVVERLLRELSLPQGNIVYASGGGFYVLAPNTPQVEATLTTVTKAIQDKLFDKHRTSLFLSLAWQPISLTTLQSGNVSLVWKDLLQKLGDQKRRKFARQLVQQYDKFFDPEAVAETGGNTQRDAITGEEIPKGAAKKLSKDDLDSMVSEDTLAQIELGKDLRMAGYRVVSHAKIAGEHSYQPADLTVWNAFVEAENAQQKGFISSAVYAINNLEGFARQTFGGSRQVLGFELYGGNDYPADKEGGPLTFNALAGAPEDDEKNADVTETNFKRLGVLRMDVDNLGHAFGNGFKEDKAETRAPFARYAALSRSLDFFFKGYLNTLWNEGKTKRGEPFREHTFIVYSGGDDLFIVGRWDVLIAFAAQIKEAFAAYTCNNPHLTLSGGIAVVPPKFPISKGADEAAEAEKQAKSHVFHERKDNERTQKHEKNAFTLFGVPLNWEHEYPAVEQLTDELVGLLSGEKTPKSLLGKIRQHYAAFMEWKHANARGEYAVERWRWQMAYDFKRLADSLRRNHEDIAKAIDQYAIEAFTYDDRNNPPAVNGGFKNITYLERLNLAARWAELELRTHS